MAELELDREAPANAGASAIRNTLTIGGTDYTVEFPSGRKASQALAILRGISGTVKAVTKALGEFERAYARDNALELDRAQARRRYPPQPVMAAGGDDVLREPDTLGVGPDERPNPRAGEPVLVPSFVDAISEADWEKAGNVLRIPKAPNPAERIGAVIDVALEENEEEVYRLLALFTLSNADVARHRKAGTIKDRLDEAADTLLDDGYLDELVELAVIIGEVIDDRFRRKIADLGSGRLGKALRLLGVEAQAPTTTPQTPPEAPQTTRSEQPEQTTPSSSSTPTSSTDSDAPTDGDPTPSSIATTASSSPSETGSTMSGL